MTSYFVTLTSAIIAVRMILRAANVTSSPKKFKTGAIVGKFYPPHAGHSYLIERACQMCESVAVVVCWKSSERPTGKQRAEWLKTIHPDVQVIEKEDIYNDDTNSQLWANLTRKFLGYTPEAVFTSEAYGDEWAKHLNAVHVRVDQPRKAFPVSGTMVRANPFKYFHHLHPIVRQHYAKVVCIVGAESTGKTVLSSRLAMYYFDYSALIGEYGREVTDRNLAERPIATQGEGFQTPEWRSDDFIEIATVQTTRIREACEIAPLVIADTDALATSIWHERYLGSKNRKVDEIVKGARVPDLYLLCETKGALFVQDGTRDGEADGKREWMNNSFMNVLRGKDNVVILKGSFEDRFKQAVTALNSHFPELRTSIED